MKEELSSNNHCKSPKGWSEHWFTKTKSEQEKTRKQEPKEKKQVLQGKNDEGGDPYGGRNRGTTITGGYPKKVNPPVPSNPPSNKAI